jgi:Na+-translocating ferredoxin:NAD+ oxidoreductase subunit A
MTALLIILLGTVLIQGSAIATHAAPHATARGVFADEFRTAAFTLLTLTLASLCGFLLERVLGLTRYDFLLTPLLLVCLLLIFMASRAVLEHIPGAIRWPDFMMHLSNQCAMLGMALYSAAHVDSWQGAIGYGLGAALLLAVLSATFNALRQRIDEADVPVVFRGIPIALIAAGFMALGLLGFAGMVAR